MRYEVSNIRCITAHLSIAIRASRNGAIAAAGMRLRLLRIDSEILLIFSVLVSEEKSHDDQQRLIGYSRLPKVQRGYSSERNRRRPDLHACRLMYPIKDDIPIMLIDEAIRL